MYIDCEVFGDVHSNPFFYLAHEHHFDIFMHLQCRWNTTHKSL